MLVYVFLVNALACAVNVAGALYGDAGARPIFLVGAVITGAIAVALLSLWMED